MKQVSLLLLYVLLFGQVLAQSGSLRGVIRDEETGEVLSGATVVVIGTYSGTYSDAEGRYELKNLKPGDYSVRFSYVGYAEKIFNGLSIAAGGVKLQDVTLSSSVSTLGEVEIVGQRTLINLESGQSRVRVGNEEIKQLSVKNIQEIVAMQAGVQQTPDGIQVRGARVYETEYLVDGVNAQDPLAGTGFGVDVNARAVQNVEVITGGAEAEYGSGSSGVVLTKIREGSDRLEFAGLWQRDNLGFRVNEGPSWNTDDISFSVGGPVIRKKLHFFISASAYGSDDYFRIRARQLHSSLFSGNDSLWAPRQDNRWSNTLKLTWTLRPGVKISLTNQHSLNINQSTRSLQIIGDSSERGTTIHFKPDVEVFGDNTVFDYK
ncbi:MAG: TonB-dependent receptor, partial [Bacteroidetes bacterium]